MRTPTRRTRWPGLALLLARCDCSTLGLGLPADASGTSEVGGTASTATDGPGSTGAVETGTGLMTDVSGSSATSGGAQESGEMCEVEIVCSRWSRGVGDVEGGQGAESHVAIDASGSVVLAGSFAGTIDLGGGKLASQSGQDIFIARYNPDGSLDWQRTFAPIDPSGVALLHDVATSPDGRIHIVGRTTHDIDLGGALHSVTTPNGWDMFVAEYGTGGGRVWSSMFGQAATEVGTHIALDADDNIFVGGSFAGGSLDLGDGVMTNEGDDAFLFKLDSGGNLLWSRQLGGPNGQQISGIGVNTSGFVVVVGEFDSSLEFAGEPILLGFSNSFLVEVDDVGDHAWSMSLSGWHPGDAHYVTGMAIAPPDSVVLGGWFEGTLVSDTWVLKSEDFSPFVIKLTARGDLESTHLFKLEEALGDGASRVHLGVGANDDLWVATTLSAPIRLGGGLLIGHGEEDLVVGRFTADGDHMWSGRFGDADSQKLDDMVVSDEGDVVASGVFLGTLGWLGGETLQGLGGSPDIFVARMGDCPACE